MAPNFEYTFDTAAHKGKTSFSTGLFIDGKFVDGSKGTTIEYVVLFASLSFPSIYLLDFSVS